MEEPIEGGTKCEKSETEAAPASSGSNGVFCGDVGIGANVGVHPCVGAVDKI